VAILDLVTVIRVASSAGGATLPYSRNSAMPINRKCSSGSLINDLIFKRDST